MAYRLVIRSHLKKLLEWLLSMDQNRPSKVRKYMYIGQPYTLSAVYVLLLWCWSIDCMYTQECISCKHVKPLLNFFHGLYLLNMEKSHFYQNWAIFRVLIGQELCSIMMWLWRNLFFFLSRPIFREIQRKWMSKLWMLWKDKKQNKTNRQQLSMVCTLIDHRNVKVWTFWCHFYGQ